MEIVFIKREGESEWATEIENLDQKALYFL